MGNLAISFCLWAKYRQILQEASDMTARCTAVGRTMRISVEIKTNCTVSLLFYIVICKDDPLILRTTKLLLFLFLLLLLFKEPNFLSFRGIYLDSWLIILFNSWMRKTKQDAFSVSLKMFPLKMYVA